MPTRNEVYAALDDERNYQDIEWGQTDSSGRLGKGERTVDEFTLYIVEYASQLQKLCATVRSPNLTGNSKLAAMRKIGGLVVAALEQHGAPHREDYEILEAEQLAEIRAQNRRKR